MNLVDGMMAQFMEDLEQKLVDLRPKAYRDIEYMFNRHVETLPDTIDKQLLAVILRIQFDTHDRAVRTFHEALGRALYGDDFVDDMIVRLNQSFENGKPITAEDDEEDDLTSSDRAKITFFTPPQAGGGQDE